MNNTEKFVCILLQQKRLNTKHLHTSKQYILSLETLPTLVMLGFSGEATKFNEIAIFFLTFLKLCSLLRMYELYHPQLATQECISSQKNIISEKMSNYLSAFLLLKSRPFKFLPSFRRPIVGQCDGNFDLLHFILANEIKIFNCNQSQDS